MALVAAAALAAGTVGAASAVPASGLVGPAGVRPGKSVTVFHNIDMVAVVGYGPTGRRITVRVVRNGVTIGSASGATVFTPEGAALEVNHGTEGTPMPGDCWDGHTPDIRPGDRIVVTDGAGRDEVVVDDIRFTGAPSPAEDGDIVVPFTAVDANGTPIPVARIDSASFRDDQLRYEPADIVVEPLAGGEPGEYHMRYESSPAFTPTRNGDDSPDEEPPLTQSQIARALLGDGHSIGFGHVAPPPAEAMLVEGVSDVSAPAPGCESVAPKMSHGVTAATPSLINSSTPADTPLRVSGFSDDASTVEVHLRDADTTVTATADVDASTDTWRTSFAATALAELSGSIRVTAVAGGTPSTLTGTVVKDTVAPDAPAASLPAGTYRGAQQVSISAVPSDRVRYTLGDGTQAAPTASRGTLYSGGGIRIRSTRTLKMVAVDSAGNASPVVQVRYQILRPPSAPRIDRATAGDPGGRTTARAAWRAPLANNGGPVIAYRVTALRLRADNSVASRRVFQIERPRARALQMRLRDGRYAFRVRAVNELGAGPMSARSNVVRSR
ncbi:MAG: chitobiase/beta-hexosaminidase C-terminal domain-containing protein [Actinomycetota bacterium]|nr:chitobiase/beta-hexosaminidase C-terminal domain-containing protein [Actinomycetota bacterium]